MPRVLGRVVQQFSLRFSAEGQPGITYDMPRHVHVGGGKTNQLPDAHDNYDGFAQRLSREAMASGKQHSLGLFGEGGLLIAGPTGHVTAHSGAGWLPDADDNVVKKMHQEAMASGKPYLTPRHHHELVPHLRAMNDAVLDEDGHYKPFLEHDHTPALAFSDWLEDHGHDDVARYVRDHIKAFGTPPEGLDIAHVLAMTPKEVQGHYQRLSDDARRYEGVELSLRFAHMTGFRPRRHEYTPKPRATDLRETDWSKIRHYFPEPEQGPKNRKTPIKVLINATLFRLENQIPLRQLEEVAPDFPPWGSVHSSEYRIAEAGLWPVILSDIGRSHLIPIAEKLIHGVKKFQEPEPTAKVTTEGLTTAEA